MTILKTLLFASLTALIAINSGCLVPQQSTTTQATSHRDVAVISRPQAKYNKNPDTTFDSMIKETETYKRMGYTCLSLKKKFVDVEMKCYKEIK